MTPDAPQDPISETTVFVVDDDEAARRSVAAVVRSIGLAARTFASGEKFLEYYLPSMHGCLVTDVRMLDMTGIELQQRLAEDGCELPVIIITAHAETPLTVQAVKAGAVTVLDKPCRDYELFDAIRDALQQDAQRRERTRRQQRFRERLECLSDQERQVLELMIDGLPNKTIARRLDCSVRTVENRRHRVFQKTSTQSLAELVRHVVEIGGLLAD